MNDSIMLNMPFSECPKWFKKRVIRIIFRQIREKGFDPLKAKFSFTASSLTADPFQEVATVNWKIDEKT